MIREIRTLQSVDQNRLRDDHKHDGSKDSFSRYLKTNSDEETAETVASAADIQKRIGLDVSAPRNQALWSAFFTDMNGTNDDLAGDPLFSWGETRENARRHTAQARQSANFNGREPVHNLNEKI